MDFVQLRIAQYDNPAKTCTSENKAWTPKGRIGGSPLTPQWLWGNGRISVKILTRYRHGSIHKLEVNAKVYLRQQRSSGLLIPSDRVQQLRRKTSCKHDPLLHKCLTGQHEAIGSKSTFISHTSYPPLPFNRHGGTPPVGHPTPNPPISSSRRRSTPLISPPRPLEDNTYLGS